MIQSANLRTSRTASFRSSHRIGHHMRGVMCQDRDIFETVFEFEVTENHLI